MPQARVPVTLRPSLAGWCGILILEYAQPFSSWGCKLWPPAITRDWRGRWRAGCCFSQLSIIVAIRVESFALVGVLLVDTDGIIQRGEFE